MIFFSIYVWTVPSFSGQFFQVWRNDLGVVPWNVIPALKQTIYRVNDAIVIDFFNFSFLNTKITSVTGINLYFVAFTCILEDLKLSQNLDSSGLELYDFFRWVGFDIGEN